MKVSRAWLQKHFNEVLPDTATLAEALTFHAFEIEEYDDDMLDVKVLPDRAAYALSHRGIAGELSAILNIPLSYDQFAEALPAWPATDKLVVTGDPAYVIRHTGALIQGVKVGPSPDWLRESLESVGQRSINNVVDALNCVMLAMGQPSGAFDAGKLAKDNGVVRIDIREARAGEKIQVLMGEEYELSEGMYVFTDAVGGTLLDIAGIKGGLASGVTEATTDLFISCGTYDPTLIRKASQSLKLFTDASLRYQNRPSAELTAYGMRQLLELITAVAGGEVIGVVDIYPRPEAAPASVSLTVGTINEKLGAQFEKEEILDAFKRLNLTVTQEGSAFVVTPPFTRRDVVIPEDLVEEAGRILGYDRVEPTALPAVGEAPDHARHRGIERVKDVLVERGFTEISTPSFAATGEIPLANPLQSEKPFLRADLAGNMSEALARAATVAPRVLGPAPDVRLFEIGTVFERDGERLSLALGYTPVAGKKKPVLADVAGELATLLNISVSAGENVLEVALGEADLEKLGADYEPRKVALEKYRPFSTYPFALRDIAVWTSAGTEEDEVSALIIKEAGELLARIDQFDRFEKDSKISYAFRLVFESFEKTLSDGDLAPAMERITAAVNAQPDWQVR